MNPLSGILSPAWRKRVYVLWSLAGLVVTAVLAYCGATEASQPPWLNGAAAALTVIGTGLGLTAASNVPTPDTHEPGGELNEEGAVTLLEVCVIALVAIAVLWAFGELPR